LAIDQGNGDKFVRNSWQDVGLQEVIRQLVVFEDYLPVFFEENCYERDNRAFQVDFDRIRVLAEWVQDHVLSVSQENEEDLSIEQGPISKAINSSVEHSLKSSRKVVHSQIVREVTTGIERGILSERSLLLVVRVTGVFEEQVE
jgi:hypothetical protein